MKTSYKLITPPKYLFIALLCLVCGMVQAQSSGLSQWLQQGADGLTSATNWSIGSSYAHSINGKGRNLADVDLDYNLNANVGLVIGAERLWDSQQSVEASIKGGLTLSASIHPFKFIGSTFLTNMVANPFVADLLSTPKGGNNIGNIVVTGDTLDLIKLKNFEFSLEVYYENRSGQTHWDGNYVGAGLRFTRVF